MSIESARGVAAGSGSGGRRRELIAYFGLTFLITWGIQLLLIASENGWGGIALPPRVHYLAAYGPMLAAILVTAWLSRGPGLKELWGRVARWRVGWGWFLIALLSPAALFAVGVAVSALLGGEIPDLALLGEVNYMPALGLAAWIFWFLTYGMGEEIGWRGFALPRLQHGRSAAGATLILGLLWALWHLPPFFYLDTYQHMGLWMYPFLAITIVCGNVVYTWIYNGTGGSVLMAVIVHASFNFFSALAAGAGDSGHRHDGGRGDRLARHPAGVWAEGFIAAGAAHVVTKGSPRAWSSRGAGLSAALPLSVTR